MASRTENTSYFILADLQQAEEKFRRETENTRLQVVTALIAAVVHQIIAGFTMAFPSQCLGSVSQWCGFCTLGSLVFLAAVGLCFSEYVKTHAAHEQFYYQELEKKLTR